VILIDAHDLPRVDHVHLFAGVDDFHKIRHRSSPASRRIDLEPVRWSAIRRGPSTRSYTRSTGATTIFARRRSPNAQPTRRLGPQEPHETAVGGCSMKVLTPIRNGKPSRR
jgi:hypothetical protein